jgi:hypothetical protein
VVHQKFGLHLDLLALHTGCFLLQFSVAASLSKTRVVLSDILGGKDVIEGCDGRTCWVVIGRIRVKMELHAQIRVYILFLVNNVG